MKFSLPLLVFIVMLAGFVYLVSPILPPFIVGIFLAWLGNPAVRALEKRGISRLIAILGVFLLLVFLVAMMLIIVLPKIGSQIVHLFHLLPEAFARLERLIPPDFAGAIGADPATMRATLAENWMKAGGVIGWLAKTAFHSGKTVAAWLANLILVPVVALYLLYDWDRVIAHLKTLLPHRYRATIIAFMSECDAVLAAFFRGQLLVMLTLGVIYAVGLTVLGVQLGVLIGVMIGFFAIVPYLGVITGFFAACLAAWLQAGNWHAFLPVVILFVVVQAMDSMFITPRLVGHRIGLHPVLVIFTVLAGGVIGGFTGVLIALPVAAMLRVLLHFVSRNGKDNKPLRGMVA